MQKYNSKVKILVFLLSLLTFNFYLLTYAQAQTMSNSQYKIKMGTLNNAAGESTGSGYSLNENLGQTGAGLYSGTNYKVRSGFQYFKNTAETIPFSFSISDSKVDFGVITPTNPLTRAIVLTVSNSSGKGFSVSAAENKSLTSQNGTIPDTSCDTGDCTPTKAAIWASTLSYGFGYRCDDQSGTNCVLGFSPSFYKPFAASPSAQNVLSSTTGGSARKSQITYKVNVSGSQPPGLYTNIVSYIANPGF